MTNSILSLSPFYKDHNFDQSNYRVASHGESTNLRTGATNFNLLIKNFLSPESKILLLCCVVENSIAGSQAVEYCHKIRSYFKGDTSEDSEELSKTAEINMSILTDQANVEVVKAYKQLAGLVSEVEKTKAFIDRMFDAKRTGADINRTNA